MKMIYSWRQPKKKTPNRVKIRLLISRIVELAGLSVPEGTLLSFIFPGSRTMRRLNKTFLNHDYLTDVICFNYSEQDKLEEGDISVEIFISPDIAATRAAENKDISYAGEIVLYIVHGILHATGMQDATLAQKKQMRIKENEIITKLKKEFCFSEIFPLV